MAKPIEIDPRDVGGEVATSDVYSADAGPAARRAASGKAPTPSVGSDVDLGIADPAITGYPHGKNQGKAVAPNTLILPNGGGTPYQPGITDTELAGDPLARGIVGGLAAQGAGAFLGGIAAPLAGAVSKAGSVGAKIAPYVVPAIAGAGGGATGAAIAGENPAEGALIGAGLSTLMHFVGSRAAERVANKPFKDVARASNATQKETLALDIGPKDVGEVLNKYKIGNINKPVVANDAVNASIDRAESALATVKDALSTHEQAMPFRVMARFGGGKTYEMVAGFPTQARADEYAFNLKAAAGNADVPASIHAEAVAENARGSAARVGELASNAVKLPTSGPPPHVNSFQALKERTIEAAHNMMGREEEKGEAAGMFAAQSRAQIQELNRDLTVLNTVRPIVAKLAVADKLRQTFLERMNANPSKLPGAMIGAAIKPFTAGATGAMRASDIALAKLFQAKQMGSPVTQVMLDAAIAAGVAPQIVARFNPANQQQMP